MKLLVHSLPVRICHWTMAAAVTVLLLTGLYLSSPAEAIQLRAGLVRKLHSFCGAILIANLTVQIYYYLFTAKWPEILFLRRDFANLPSLARYLLFITDGMPNYGRYNPGQKLLYSTWLLGILCAAATGAALFFPSDAIGFQRLLGGLNAIRLMHFSVALLFAASIPAHIYLVFTESPASLQAMFTGYVNFEPAAGLTELTTGRPPAPPEDGPHR